MPFCCLRTLIGETDPMSGNQEGTWLKDQQLNQLAWTLPNATHGTNKHSDKELETKNRDQGTQLVFKVFPISNILETLVFYSVWSTDFSFSNKGGVENGTLESLQFSFFSDQWQIFFFTRNFFLKEIKNDWWLNSSSTFPARRER